MLTGSSIASTPRGVECREGGGGESAERHERAAGDGEHPFQRLVRGPSDGQLGWGYGLQIPVEVSIFQLVAQVIDTVVPLMVSGSQM